MPASYQLIIIACKGRHLPSFMRVPYDHYTYTVEYCIDMQNVNLGWYMYMYMYTESILY